MPLNSLYIIAQKFISIGMGIFGLGFIIAFHELGHFLFCKLFNVKTPTFSIGFGPILVSRMIGETLFKISLIPLGGYVEIAGLAEAGQGEQTSAYATDETSFTKKPYWQKLLIMVGGIVFNLAFAYFIFITIFFVGAPKSMLLYPTIAKPIIAQVVPHSPAATSGLQAGDTITHIQDIALDDSINSFNKNLHKITIKALSTDPSATQTEPIKLSIIRNSTPATIIISPEIKTVRSQTSGYLGVVFELHEKLQLSLIEAVKQGICETNRWIKNTINDFIHLSRFREVKELAGPLMIISMSSRWAHEGFLLFILFLAIISINLAVLNLLPIPILDGGQILFHTIEAVIRRQIPDNIRMYIHIACWIAFLALFVYLSWHDVVRIMQSILAR